MPSPPGLNSGAVSIIVGGVFVDPAVSSAGMSWREGWDD